MPEGIALDAGTVSAGLTRFIREELAKTGFGRLILGISGGLDSAVVAYLAVNAIGKENVVGLIMPYKTSNPENMADAEILIESLGIKKRIVDISDPVNSYFERFPDADNIRRGNKMARERMSVLYDFSAMEKALVIGTSNRSEILLGYGTIFGDLACAINPLGDLYKSQVRALAKHLGVPDRIIAKIPSADLHKGQSDEGEFGFSYEEVDRLLHLMIDKKHTPSQCAEKGFSEEMIRKVNNMIEKNRFKGSPPVIARLGGILKKSGSGVPGDAS
ncbi:MAG: NAD+ synthase [candidate division Zixibacteria bacterium]